MKSPLPPIRFQSWSETQAVYPSGNRPTMAKRMKNGEIYRYGEALTSQRPIR
jgi:hypothetical protein